MVDIETAMVESVINFEGKNVMIIGDVMLDCFVFGEAKHISPEAPIPVVRVRNEKQMLGGAGNVAKNIKDLGANPYLIGVIGKDFAGNRIKNILDKAGMKTDGLVSDEHNKRPTTIKTRILAQNQQIVRFDKEWDSIIESPTSQAIIGRIAKAMPMTDIIIVSDYNKGVIGSYLTNALGELAKGKMIIVDPKPHNMRYYEGMATVLTPNHNEAFQMANVANGNQNVNFAAHYLLNTIKCRGILITRGKEGMSYYEQKAKPIHVKANVKTVYDVTGAGDTVTATFALAMLTDLPMDYKVLLSNIAASVVIQELGTTTITKDMLINAIKEHYGKPGPKDDFIV